ncbi:hypothetical protein [Bacillus siamensis]|nr:hypothetical protein [Bacillus siamensis]
MPRLIWHIVGGDFDADTFQTVAYFKMFADYWKKEAADFGRALFLMQEAG